jgi:hypothetical protein
MRMHKLVPLVLALAVALVALPATAQSRDRDGDGMSDRWEKRHKVKRANADTDRDGVDNRNEYREGTKPRDRDSDDDRRSDGREDRDRDGLNNRSEDATGNDPKDKDTDNDGIPDGKEQAGVVSAYEDGVLTIDLANGGSVSGRVTEDTDVDCATEAQAEGTDDTATTSHRHGEEGPAEGRRPRGEGGGFGCDGSRDGADSDDVECPEGALAVGAKVHEASLRITSDGAVFKEIELLIPAS